MLTGLNTGTGQQSAAQQKQTLGIIWWGYLAAVVPYWWVKNMAAGAEPQAETASLVLVLALLAVIGSAVSWIWSGKLLGELSKRVQPGQGAQVSVEEAGKLSQKIYSMTVAFLAFFEAAAVYGLVAHFVGSPYPNTFENFLVFSVANLVIYKMRNFPQTFQLLDRLGNIRKGTG